jgi:hypothetical protein
MTHAQRRRPCCARPRTQYDNLRALVGWEDALSSAKDYLKLISLAVNPHWKAAFRSGARFFFMEMKPHRPQIHGSIRRLASDAAMPLRMATG